MKCFSLLITGKEYRANVGGKFIACETESRVNEKKKEIQVDALKREWKKGEVFSNHIGYNDLKQKKVYTLSIGCFKWRVVFVGCIHIVNGENPFVTCIFNILD